MAKFRSIQTSFWSDSKIVDEFEPEDRYFYLYLLTNEKSNQLGCYELSKKQMCRDTGYDIKTVDKLVDRLEKELDVIYYDCGTKEVFIKNWYKYNWLNSWKTKSCISKEFSQVKSAKITEMLCPLYAPYMPLPSNNNKKNNNNNNNNNNKKKKNNNNKNMSSELDGLAVEVLNYMNKIANRDFKHNETNHDLIKTWLTSGFTIDDCKDVIFNQKREFLDRKLKKGDKDLSKYYRPSTIFGDNFEGYLQDYKQYNDRKE